MCRASMEEIQYFATLLRKSMIGEERPAQHFDDVVS
jgi:hypothetical protein